MSPDAPVLPTVLWQRLRSVLAAAKERGESCRIVLIINVKRGEPVDGDILATEPPVAVDSG